MEMIKTASIDLQPVKLLTMETKKVWGEKNKKNNPEHKYVKSKEHSKKASHIKYTKDIVLDEFKRFGGQFVYFPKYKDSDIASEGYLLAAEEEQGNFYYFYLDKDRNILRIPATKIFQFKQVPVEFFVIQWLTTHPNEDIYNQLINYFSDISLITDIYFKFKKDSKKKETEE